MDTIVMFNFDYGTKRIEDCSRAELLVVVRSLASDIERVRDMWKRDREFRDMMDEARKRHGF